MPDAGPEQTDDASAARPPPFEQVPLDGTVVRYEDRPNRYTVHPPEEAAVRLGAWIAADLSDTCPLRHWR